MGRKEDRINNQIEKNPVAEFNNIQQRFCPKLFKRFSETADPRHQSYVEYSNKMMLGSLYYKEIVGSHPK